MGSQRVGHNLAIEQQQFLVEKSCPGRRAPSKFLSADFVQNWGPCVETKGLSVAEHRVLNHGCLQACLPSELFPVLRIQARIPPGT